MPRDRASIAPALGALLAHPLLFITAKLVGADALIASAGGVAAAMLALVILIARDRHRM